MTLVTTGRLDAVLHEPSPESTGHTIGRPCVGGLRLPALEQVLQDLETVWQKLTLDWYGEGERTLEICTQTATFRDVLALVRRQLWSQETFPTSPTDPDAVLVPRSTLEWFSLAVC